MALNIQRKGTNIELTEAIENYIDKKLEPLHKFLQNHPEHLIDVEVGKTTNHHKSGDIFRAEVNVFIKENMLRAVAEAADLYAAIDDVKDEILQVIKKHHTKSHGMFRRGARRMKDMIRGYLRPRR
jgi:putative sigma-54 modulation protein